MTNEQVGKYIRLLCMQHQKGGDLTEKDMLFICQSYDKDIFGKFIKENDLYHNERLRSETEKRVKYSESRSKNRLNRINICQTHDKDMINICQSYDRHMENENENENINKDINSNNKENVIAEIYSEDFLVFWKAYPSRSGSKKDAFDVWKKFGKSRPDMETLLSAIKIQKDWRENPNGEFRPEWKHADGWLKKRMWESDFKTETKKAIGVPKSDFIFCSKCGERTFRGDLNEAGVCLKCEGTE
jgi:hypothetical protein